MVNWQNWGRSEQTEFVELLSPSQVEQIRESIVFAGENGRKIRPIGSSHSFSGIGTPVDQQMDLSRMRGLLSVDRERKQVTLAAGTLLWEIPQLLAPLGLAMENLGDIDRQTIAGAISTGTHGTGRAFGGLATQVRGLKMVNGLGEIVFLSPEVTPDIWEGAVIGLGALGMIVEVTLQCVDAFDLIATERKMPLSVALDQMVSIQPSEQQFEFYWFTGTESAASKLNQRVVPCDFGSSGSHAVPGKPRHPVRAWFDDEFMANGVFQATTSLSSLMPAVVPSVNRIAAGAMANNMFRAPSHEVLVRPRRVRFREMEYAFELSAIPEVFAELQNMVERKRLSVSFPIEVRAAAADDLWLSTAYQRTSGYIAIHRYWKEDPSEYFQAFEDIAKAYNGRPHWGKMHYLDAENLAELYPRFAEFLSLRERFDPKRIFANTMLNRVLGQ